MKKSRIYLDTSVIGAYFDEEFKDITIKLFEKIKVGDYNFVISDLTKTELLQAPSYVKDLLDELEIKFQTIDVTDEAIILAEEYLKENIVGKSSRDDCLHIATLL